MFHFFEKTLKPTAVPETAEPPPGLVAFYWHFARQAKPLFIGLFAVGFAVALIEVMIPVFIGKVVTMVTASKPEELLATAWPWLLGMAGVLLVLRPAASTTQLLLMNQAIAANVSNRIRWQNHWHVSRQSWAFFQNDFAGRIATRVMQTGPAIRESLVALLTAVWFILIYGTSSLIFAGFGRPLACAPGAALVRGLYRNAALFRPPHARQVEGDVGSTFTVDRPDRRYLHEHRYREA